MATMAMHVHAHAFALTSLFVFDKTVNFCLHRVDDEKKREHTKWCAVHALVNLVIATYSFPSLWATFRWPTDSLEPTPTMIPVILGLWLHMYHALFYSLSSDDKWHHVFFVLILGTPAYMYTRRVTNCMLFFISGVPGAIIYAFIALRRCNVFPFTKWDEPKLSLYVNLFFRTPGVLLTCYFIIIGVMAHPEDMPWPVVLIQVLLPIINVTYYTRQSVLRVERRG